MTRDHARKKAIRARMDASGEPYSTAARNLDADQAPGAPSAVDEVVARVNSTLASSWARLRVQTDWAGSLGPEYHLGPAERLAAFAARVAGKRMPSGTYLGGVREKLKQALLHPEGEGFIEPAAERYQLVFGGDGIAVMQLDGDRYQGPVGAPLEARHRSRPSPDEPLGLLGKLSRVTDARQVGREPVRGTPCRVIAVKADSAEFTVWIDDEHTRRIRTETSGGSSERVSLSVTKTLELWDFGAQHVPADWTRLPDSRAAEHRTTPGR